MGRVCFCLRGVKGCFCRFFVIAVMRAINGAPDLLYLASLFNFGGACLSLSSYYTIAVGPDCCRKSVVFLVFFVCSCFFLCMCLFFSSSSRGGGSKGGGGGGLLVISLSCVAVVV